MRYASKFVNGPAAGSSSSGFFGVPLGAAGSGIRAGYTMRWARLFADQPSLVTPFNPKGDWYTTRGYSNGGGMRAPPSGALAVMYDASPEHTGWQDANRGVPIAWDAMGGGRSHSIVAGPPGHTALRLLSGAMSTAEAALLNTGVAGQVNRAAMLHSAGCIQHHPPDVVDVYARLPLGPGGQHYTTWFLSALPVACTTGNESGFEGNGGTGVGGSTPTLNAYQDDHVTAGSIVPDAGTLNIGVVPWRDGQFHWFTRVTTTSSYLYYVDDVLVNTITHTAGTTGSPTGRGDQPDYILLTHHIYGAAFPGGGGGENYGATSWNATNLPNGQAVDIACVRVWGQGSHYVGQGAYANGLTDIKVAPGGAISTAIPSAASLWGSSVADTIQAIPNEVEEPGGSNAATFATLPAFLSWNSGTRILSGTAPNANFTTNGYNCSGELHLQMQLDAGSGNRGNTCEPIRFRLLVAPFFVGATSAPFTNGTPGSNYDLYAAWDCGRLILPSGGTAGKQLTATNLPPGMTLLSTGVISGAPTTNGSYTVATSCTNSEGQTTSQNITMTIAAAASPVAAPAGISTGTLVGSWDPQAGTQTVVSGAITALPGVDGLTGITLANAGGTGPTQATMNDGLSVARTVATFLQASSQYLKLASGMGLTGATGMTDVLIFSVPANGATVSYCLGEVSTGSATFSNNRGTMIWSTAGLLSWRKVDNAATTSSAATGTAVALNTIHIAIGRSPAGAGTAAKLNLDGVGTAITAGATSGNATTFNTTMMGDSEEASTQSTKFASMSVFRRLTYSGSLSDADCETIATWAATNYGTPNLA